MSPYTYDIALNTLHRRHKYHDMTEQTASVMPRSRIHGSPRRFHYGLILTDGPGNANFRSLMRMHSGVATGFDVSTKDKVGKEPFGDTSDTDSHRLIRNASV